MRGIGGANEHRENAGMPLQVLEYGTDSHPFVCPGVYPAVPHCGVLLPTLRASSSYALFRR